MAPSSLLAALIVFFLICGCAQQSAAPTKPLEWPPVTQLNKPWTRWWWMGSAVDEKNLKREIEQMHAAGIGGVEITPLYGVAGQESRNIDFLSPKWLQMLRYTAQESKKLDFGVDMATGTGWPFGGGPEVTPDVADAVVNRVDGKLVSRPTMMRVKRAAPGNEGWVLNPYSVKAIEKYLNWFAPLKTLPRGLVRGQFHDSFEYAGNWTPELPERFKAMHGYDINDHVSELFGEGEEDRVSRIKSDFREVLDAMHYDYVDYWVKWSHQNGYEARNQAHGAPGNLLDLYGVADVPETETFGSSPFKIPGFRRDASDIASNGNGPNHIVTRFATSAQHVMGRQLSSCETLTWLREHWKVALSMAKPEVDQMFLTGINHILYHGTCYSPDDAGWPGWQFYASSEINPSDTLWKTLPELNQYIQRCQSILQSGSPDNDVLLYFPFYDHLDSPNGMEVFFKVHIAPPWLTGTQIEKTAQELTEHGYAFDMVSDRQLAQTSNDGKGLKVPGGKYQALLVPKTGKIPVPTLKRILDLAEGGATVVFMDELPKDVPGLARLDERRGELKTQLARLKEVVTSGTATIRTYGIGAGTVLVGSSMDLNLTAAKVRRESFANADIGFIRRKHDGGHHYFIASLGTAGVDGWMPLAVPVQSAVLMDGLTGKTGTAAVRKGAKGAEIYLQLKPGESVLVRTFDDRAVQGSSWAYNSTAGEPVALAGNWSIDFIDGEPAKPAAFRTDKLGSWTDRDDPEAKRFAGTARYRLEFDRPANITGESVLDLGDVREAAVVRLNGKEIGHAWSLPFQLPLPALKERGNVLEIDVTNMSANRIRDIDIRGVKWRIFKEINYVNIDYKPFDASGWPLSASGLLGPVRLVPVRTLAP